MVFDTNRACHSRGVVLLMRRLTPIVNKDFGLAEGEALQPDLMALTGWLHDFGYLLDIDPDAHAEYHVARSIQPAL